MKISIVISGQSRDSSKIDPSFIKKFNPVEVVLSTWDEPEAQATISAYNPDKYVLADPNIFKSLKEKFWSDFKKNCVNWQERVNIINGDFVFKTRKSGLIIESPHRDNTLRFWYLLSKGIELLTKKCDYIIYMRPDICIQQMEIKELKNNTIGVRKRNHWQHVDFSFYGRAGTMKQLCSSWNNLGEIVGKSDRMAWLKGPRWLYPETFVVFLIKYYYNYELFFTDFRYKLLRHRNPKPPSKVVKICC